MYRRRKFHQLPKRNQKRIVSAIIRKSIWSFWVFVAIFAILAYLYNQWEFLFPILFILPTYALLSLYSFLKRRELQKYYTIDALQKKDPSYFERYIIELFNTLGYKLEWTGQTGDKGIDGMGIDPKGNKVILQTKRYKDTNKIQPIDIREFIGTLEYHNVDIGIYVTTGFATEGIHDYIRIHDRKHIFFVDKDELAKLIIKAYKSRK